MTTSSTRFDKYIRPTIQHLPTIGKWSILIGLLLGFFFCPSCLGKNWLQYFKISLHSSLITFFLWSGNNALTDFLDLKMKWIEFPIKRTIWGVFLTVFISIGIFFTLNLLLMPLFYEGVSMADYFQQTHWRDFTFPMLITFVFTVSAHGVAFFKEWKKAFVENEHLKREHLASQYETLKNQVNPHFLFNSLNALSTLVYKDQDLAAKFIKQLSVVYRHVLDIKDKEVVPLSVELDALEAYVFLLRIRFADSLKINMDIQNINQYLIAPLALQMLVENAVKHNIIARSQPLTIDVFIKNDYIIVSNNLQIKNSVSESSGIGLPNIKARYQYISDKKVIVESKEEQFAVKIPLVTY